MKISKVFIVLAVIGVLGLGRGLFYSLRSYNKDVFLQRMLAEKDSGPDQKFYIPSPVEYYFLDSKKELWPRIFSSQNPLTAERVPEFYTALTRIPDKSEISDSDLEELRLWSVLLNAGHTFSLIHLFEVKDSSTLSTLLKKEDLPREKRYLNCSLFQQEKAFRLGQLGMVKLKDEARKYLRSCQSSSLLGSWLELQEKIEQKDTQSLGVFADRLRMQSLQADRSFHTWFAGVLYKVAWVSILQGTHSH